MFQRDFMGLYIGGFKCIQRRAKMPIYKDYEGKDIEPEWHIIDTADCPDLNCSGTLLYSIYYHPRKCNKCGKLWMDITKWIEVKELS